MPKQEDKSITDEYFKGHFKESLQGRTPVRFEREKSQEEIIADLTTDRDYYKRRCEAAVGIAKEKGITGICYLDSGYYREMDFSPSGYWEGKK